MTITDTAAGLQERALFGKVGTLVATRLALLHRRFETGPTMTRTVVIEGVLKGRHAECVGGDLIVVTDLNPRDVKRVPLESTEFFVLGLPKRLGAGKSIDPVVCWY
jgi:hypothetical protein